MSGAQERSGRSGGGGRRANELAIYSPGAAVLYEAGEAEERSRTGGAELQTFLLATELVRYGRRVAHIVYELGGRRRVGGPTLVQRPDHRGSGRRFGKLVEAIEVWRALRAADADVYLFRGSSLAFAVGAVFAQLHRRRLLFSAANDLDFTPNRADRGRAFSLLAAWALRRADRVVVQTDAQLSLVRSTLPEDRTGIELIRSFAEDAELSREAPRWFLWATRLVPYKRPLEFLKLAAALPEQEFKVVAAATTETPPELIDQLEHGARELENLELLPGLPREQVLELMDRSVAIVSTSRYEGMPNVFLEGWARGIPSLSLSFDPDGLIERRGLGRACEGDWDRFVAAADRLAADPEERRQLADRARRYVVEEHSIAAVARRWNELLSAMLAA